MHTLRNWFYGVVLVLSLVLVACGAAPTVTPAPTNTPIPPTSTPLPPVPPTSIPVPLISTPAPPQATPIAATLAASIDVGGYKLFVTCVGAGAPTIVFDNGSTMGYDYWGQAVIALKSEARVCTYYHAGVGVSEKSPKSPRTSMDMVEDLHTLLGKIGVTPPYVLVGHSLGAQNVRIYAGRWPAEVGGIVLVDDWLPDEYLTCDATLPPETASENAALAGFRASCKRMKSGIVRWEGEFDLIASAHQAQAAGPLGGMPLVVVSESPAARAGSSFPAGYPEDLAAKWQQRHSELQKTLVSQSTRGTQVVAERAGHNVPAEEADAVIKGIHIVLKQVRGQ